MHVDGDSVGLGFDRQGPVEGISVLLSTVKCRRACEEENTGSLGDLDALKISSILWLRVERKWKLYQRIAFDVGDRWGEAVENLHLHLDRGSVWVQDDDVVWHEDMPGLGMRYKGRAGRVTS